MKYLVVMEVSQKQNYIFKTNRLAEQICRSGGICLRGRRQERL